MEQFFQCPIPAPSPVKVIQIPDIWGWEICALVNYGIMMDHEWTQSYESMLRHSSIEMSTALGSPYLEGRYMVPCF